MRLSGPFPSAARKLWSLGPDFLVHPPPGSWGFAGRTALASVLALYAAFLFQLESPYWAATTALIVANPVYGQIVSKSIYRVLGTLLGVIMALFLTACFLQTPELFILALALWVGSCLAVATMLRNFQAYGAMLAGLTTALISLAVISEHPLNIFDVAMARMAAILVGIAASAVVSSLLKPGGARHNLELKIEANIRASVGLLKMLADPRQVPDVKNKRRLVAGDILTLDGLATFAAAESARVREQRNGLLSIGAALLHVVTAVGNAAYSLNRMTPLEREEPLLQAALAEVAPAAEIISRMDASSRGDLVPIYERLALLEKEAAGQELPDVLVVIHRIGEVLEQLMVAIETRLDWQAGHVLQTQARFDFHRELPDAFRNGGRCFLAILASGAFWIFTAWPSGANMVIIVVIVCSFGATQEDPLAFGPPFLVGVLVLIPLALVCDFFIVARILDFIPLALLLMGCVMIGSLASVSANRWVGGVGRTFMALFFTILALRDPMIYDLSSFLNTSLATIAGVDCAIVSTILFLPPDPIGRAFRLVATLCGETEELVRHQPVETLPPRSVWESQMYDRLRLSLPHIRPKGDEVTVLDSAYAAVLIGTSVIDLRNRASSPQMPRPSATVIHQAVDRLVSMRSAGEETARALTESARQLARASEGNFLMLESRNLLIRSASSLRGIAVMVEDLAPTFGPVQPIIPEGARA